MVNNKVIGGMTFASYDPDNDPRGAIGLALAEAKMRELRGDFSRLNDPFSEVDAQREKRLSQERYNKLFRLVEGSGIDMRVGRDTERKRSFLLEAGYQPFKGSGGVEILIEKASGERIDNSFRIIYRQACAHASRE